MELVEDADLGIKDSESYYCQVWGFQYSHSLMLIRATKGDFLTGESIFLMFGEVRYFEGPTHWKGVNLHFGSQEEAISLIRRTQLLRRTDLTEDDYLSTRRLYKIGPDQGGVTILASSLYQGEDKPEGFS